MQFREEAYVMGKEQAPELHCMDSDLVIPHATLRTWSCWISLPQLPYL